MPRGTIGASCRAGCCFLYNQEALVPSSPCTKCNKAIGDSRLCPRVRDLAAPPGESRRIIRHVAHFECVSVFGPTCEKMTSSTKPEVRNVLHCRHRRTEPGTETCTKNFVMFGHVVLETCERTDRQTWRHADRNTSHAFRRRSNNCRRD